MKINYDLYLPNPSESLPPTLLWGFCGGCLGCSLPPLVSGSLPVFLVRQLLNHISDIPYFSETATRLLYITVLLVVFKHKVFKKDEVWFCYPKLLLRYIKEVIHFLLLGYIPWSIRIMQRFHFNNGGFRVERSGLPLLDQSLWFAASRDRSPLSLLQGSESLFVRAALGLSHWCWETTWLERGIVLATPSCLSALCVCSIRYRVFILYLTATVSGFI